MVRFLQKQGFRIVRIRGSHHVMERGSLRTSVPVHADRNLKIGTQGKILRDVELSPQEFERLWGQ
jgi:predicted RNA binding protein YcfA (HicA-like mRNA interferase family)